jgi:hypothetical protein
MASSLKTLEPKNSLILCEGASVRRGERFSTSSSAFIRIWGVDMELGVFSAANLPSMRGCVWKSIGFLSSTLLNQGG